MAAFGRLVVRASGQLRTQIVIFSKVLLGDSNGSLSLWTRDLITNLLYSGTPTTTEIKINLGMHHIVQVLQLPDPNSTTL